MDKTGRFIILLVLMILVFFFPLVMGVNRIAGNYGDVFLHYYPLKYLAAEHIISGKIPLWNPYIFAGQPLLANPQSAVFYPFTLLFFILPLPAAFNYFFVIHFFICGLFMFLFLRLIKISFTGSIMGTMALTFSSFLVYQVPSGHPVALSGYVWLPAAAMAIAQLQKSDTYTIWFQPMFLSLVLTFQFLSGHAQPVYISAIFVIFYIIFNRFKSWKTIIMAGVLFALLSALQLLPAYELSKGIENSIWPQLAKSYSLPVKNLINLLLPNYFGNPINGSFIFHDNPTYFFDRHAVYFGILPLFLALSGLVYFIKARKLFYPLLAVTGLALAFGFNLPLYGYMYRLLPGLKFLRAPGRFYYLSLFCLIVMAASVWPRHKIKILLLIVIFADLWWWGNKFIYTYDMTGYRTKSTISAYIKERYRIATEPEVISPNRSMLYHHYNTGGYEAILLKDYTRYIGLQEKLSLSPTGLARIDFASPLSRGLATGYALTTKNIPFGVLLSSPASQIKLYSLGNAIPRVFFPATIKAMDVMYQTDYLSYTRFSPDQEVVVNIIPDGFSPVQDENRIANFVSLSDKITIEAYFKKPTAVVFSEMFYPGWRAAAGNTNYKIYRGNNMFRLVFLPAGNYTGAKRVIMYYRPASWLIGLYITLASLLVLGIYFISLLSKLDVRLSFPQGSGGNLGSRI